MRRSIASAAAVIFLAGLAWGVTPAKWRHASEADFTGGEFKTTGVNSRGEISLGREITVLMSSKDAPAVVSAMVVADKVIYAAAGPEPEAKAKGAIYKIVGKKVSKIATVPTVYVTTLAWGPAGLLAGAGGQGAGIYAIDAKGTVKKIWSDAEVKYVWSIVPAGKNTLYAATGVKGRVYEIDVKTGKGTVAYDGGKLAKNILCLALVDGMLCAGTDEKGLVVEIDLKAKTSRVILDAAEKEIAAILPGPDGGYFVATSDASKANADGTVKPATGKTGKAGGATTAPAPGKAGPKTPAKAGPKAPAKAPPQTTDKKRKPAVQPPNAKPPVKAATITPVARRTTTGTLKPSTAATTSSAVGNAVYYIQKDGLARTVFRKPLTILDMIKLNGDELVLATGNGGAIYKVTIDGDLVTQLADTDAKQVTAVGLAGDGKIAFATANAGSVGTLAGTPAKKGTYVSKAQDAKQFSRWGSVLSRVTAGAGGKVTFATRSGNLAKPDDATWSKWSAEQAVDGGYLQIASPSARFLQYRFTLQSGGGASPAVHDVVLSYQVGNLAPALTGVTAAAVAKMDSKVSLSGALVFRQIAITAADPNGDALVYKIEYRQAGEKQWIKMVDKLTKPVHFWNTLTMGDGRYELRITASDKNANTSTSAMEAVRISEPITVDNTPPVLARLAAQAKGKTITVSGQITDALSAIKAIQYTVDSDEQWHAIVPSDGITDSTRESFSVDITDSKPGLHRIAVRAVDALGNTGYAATTVTVGK